MYSSYTDAFIKGIAFYLTITGALLKFAVDSTQYRTPFAVAGIARAVTILIPLLYGALLAR